MKNALGMIAGVGVLLLAPVALAQPADQAPPAPQPAPQQLPPPPPPSPAPAPPPPTVTATVTATEPKKDDGVSDHEKVVGKFGVMYFGVTQQPIGTGQPNAVGRGSVNTPIIGMRYWLQERFGIDAGLGFNFFSSSSNVTENNQAERTADGPAVMAFMLHAGLPIAFAYGKHYKFLVVPEVNFGYATQTEAAQNLPPGAPTPPDIHRTGLRLDVGGRVGTEIQFGFIGIPELALQASIGLNFRHQVWHASRDAGPGVQFPSESTQTASNVGTTVQADPWALFVNNVSAIYYFP